MRSLYRRRIYLSKEDLRLEFLDSETQTRTEKNKHQGIDSRASSHQMRGSKTFIVY